MENIAEYLFTPKTRTELCDITGLSDRKNRAKIRSSGETICNLQDGKGYFYADKNTPEGQQAIRAQHNLFLSRIFELWDSDKPFRQSLMNLDQLTLTDVIEGYERKLQDD